MAGPNDVALTFAKNLQRLMDRHELSQAALSRKSGVGQSTLSKILNVKDPENMNPRASTIDRLATYFGFPGWQLLIPDLPDDVLFSRSREPGLAPITSSGAGIDPALLSSCIQTAMTAFRNQRRVPNDQHLAAAAAYVYAHVSTGRRMKDAEKAVQQLLEKAGDSVPSFADLH